MFSSAVELIYNLECPSHIKWFNLTVSPKTKRGHLIILFQGGIYFFKIIDFYSSAISLMLVAFFEVIAVAWFYGMYLVTKFVDSTQ